MSMELVSNSGLGAIEFRSAMEAANRAKNALFRSYGFTAPSATGEYDIQSAQAAFDPNTLFDKATGGIDEARAAQLAGSLQMGGTGIFSDIARAGAAEEAQVAAQTRAAGLGGGGLAAQRARLAEAQAAQQQTGARQEFLGQLGQAFAPIGETFQRMEMQRLQDEAARLGSEAGSAVTPDYGMPIEEAPFEEEVAVSEETGTPPARPTVKDIRSKPEGSKLSPGAAGEFNTLLKSNRGNLANLKGMLKKWDLTPAQRTAVQRQINAASKARKGVEEKPAGRQPQRQTRPAQRPQAQRQPQRQARPAPAPKPKPKPKKRKK